MILKDHLEYMSESVSVTLGRLLDPKLISFVHGIGTDFKIKISDPVSSIEYLNKHFEDSDGDVYVSIDGEDFDKIKKLKVKHAEIGSDVICDSDLSRTDIEKCKVQLGHRNFYVSSDRTHFRRTGP